jgi:DNA-binding transcriptional LysR family regulator
MDHSKILNDIWPWIPAFRVVAESQHLPTAARQLHVTASALSRTVHLVESAVGHPLFVRRSARLALNARGHALLDAIRRGVDAMRGAVGRVYGAPSGEFHIALAGPIAHYLVPAVLSLVDEFPAVVPSLHAVSPRQALVWLQEGRLDLLLHYHASAEQHIVVERLGELTSSIYCGRAHPLWRKRVRNYRDVLSHAFSVPHSDDTGASLDDWPPDVPRRVGLRITSLATQVDVAESGRFLAVLPDMTAAPLRRRKELRRLCAAPVAIATAYASYAPGFSGHPYLEQLLTTLRARLAAARRNAAGADATRSGRRLRRDAGRRAPHVRESL